MQKRIGKPFKIRTDKGTIYDVLESVAIIPAGDLQNPHDTIEGLRSYRTTTGEAVNRKSETDFEVLEFGGLVPARRVP